MGELMGYVDQITSYGFSSTDLGNKAVKTEYQNRYATAYRTNPANNSAEFR